MPAFSPGTVNVLTPYAKLALVENTVLAPRVTTIPTLDTFDSRKLSANGLRALAVGVRSVSAGGVVRSAVNC